MNIKQTRYIRRLEDGTYTIKPDTKLNNAKDMCDVCGIKTACPIYKTRSSLLQQGAEFEINKCARYVPLISFRKPYLGLKDAYFNTMRSGVTWVNRVNENSIVCLVGSEKGDTIRFARVAKVFSGPMEDMLRKHARFNHLCLGGMKQDDVRTVIKKSYGHFLKEDSSLTVIYLKSLKHEYDWQYHTDEEIRLMEDIDPPDNVISLEELRRRFEEKI
ncbi:TPA: hypothetical protein ACKE3U_003726 [Klebsiella aerogenes]